MGRKPQPDMGAKPSQNINIADMADEPQVDAMDVQVEGAQDEHEVSLWKRLLMELPQIVDNELTANLRNVAGTKRQNILTAVSNAVHEAIAAVESKFENAIMADILADKMGIPFRRLERELPILMREAEAMVRVTTALGCPSAKILALIELKDKENQWLRSQLLSLQGSQAIPKPQQTVDTMPAEDAHRHAADRWTPGEPSEDIRNEVYHILAEVQAVDHKFL
ncbi:unnamed protein product [Haemonchus placei]|uniref:Gag protein n=1 Tax=Haemonchus placei TaxID=6290 RepID=A0A0N4WYM0_HAEPC|nr:unnamed protein product [Haemonchus placei]